MTHSTTRALPPRSLDRALRAWVIGDRTWACEGVTSGLLDGGFRSISVQPGWAIHQVESGPEPDLVLVQHSPPGHDGIKHVREVRRSSDVPLILLSTVVSISECERAIRAGANRFLPEDEVGRRIGEIGLGLARGSRCIAEEQAPSIRTAAAARTFRDRELRDRLLRLLRESGGNVAEMARRMDRDPSTVRYHLERFGMLGRIARVTPDRRSSRG